MIIGKIAFILASCAIEYVAIHGILDYFHDKRYSQEEKEYAEAMAYLKSFNKKEEF